MPITSNIVHLPELRICDADGFTNVAMAQPAFVPRRNEDTGYGPATEDVEAAESFVDDCLAALVAANREHNLVIFPEAFVPSSRVPALTDFMSADCPVDTVVIAGIESLSLDDVFDSNALSLDEDYKNLLQKLVAPQHRFLNACLILVRDGQGTVHRFVQPKMHPSHAEQTLPGMLTSDEILFFTCPQFSFGVLICSDFIQRPQGTWLPVAFVDALEQTWNASNPATPLPVDLIVNIQCNPRPNHDTFRAAATALLYARRSSVRLDAAFVLLSNWGGLWDGGEPVLSAALIYQRQFWRPPPKNDSEVPHSYSFTEDTVTDDLNIAAIRSQSHGRVRFRMLPCSRANQGDPSRRLPLHECYFEVLSGGNTWSIEYKSAWHDRCERWLPETIPGSQYAQFWSVPNNPAVEMEIHQKYIVTRACVLGKAINDLKQDLLCLVLSFDDLRNPDTWGQQERAALNKWASLATLFHYDDDDLSFDGEDWYSFRWRGRVCIAVVDGRDLASCNTSMANYRKRFGRKLPEDPKLDSVALVVLYRHTRDSRQAVRRAEPLVLESYARPNGQRAGIREEALAVKPDDLSRPRIPPRVFWCTADDFDVVLETGEKAAFHAAMENICEPALD